MPTGDLAYDTCYANNLTRYDSTPKWFSQAGNIETVATKTSDYTLTSKDGIVFVDATSAPVTITLPTAVGITVQYSIVAITTNTNLVTVAASSGQTISGTSTTTLGAPSSGAPFTSITIISDGANWWIS